MRCVVKQVFEDDAHTEELLEVHVEVSDITIGTDKGQDSPVRVGALPQVPFVAGNLDVREDL